MKSIVEWEEKEVLEFIKCLGLSLSNITGLVGFFLIKISNRELKDEFKLKFNERHLLLDSIKKEEMKSKL